MTPTVCNNIERNILILECEAKPTAIMLAALARKNMRGTVVVNLKDTFDCLEKSHWDMVVVSRKFAIDGERGISREFLERIKSKRPEMPVIILSEQNHAKDAVEAIHAGYTDFLCKPLDLYSLEELLLRLIPEHKTEVMASGNSSTGIYKIIGASKALRHTIEIARKAAPSSVPVLITGQSGTGKELVAELIHNESRRARGPFIKINCAALNDSILESELFGHEKGAFTGAGRQHHGKFERANCGTILLDEITETGPRLQAELLRVLEQMDFERVGGTENINVNVRIISTTNTDILEHVRKNKFRLDLFYRLAGIRLVVPPLCERKSDIPLLVWHFVNQFSHQVNRQIKSLDPVMLEIFERYHWPGNIRQLRNIVQTSMILGSGHVLSLADVSWLMDELQCDEYSNESDLATLAGHPLDKIERHAIIATLNQTDGNQTKAAKVLGISDRTLRDKLKKYRQKGHLQLS